VDLLSHIQLISCIDLVFSFGATMELLLTHSSLIRFGLHSPPWAPPLNAKPGAQQHCGHLLSQLPYISSRQSTLYIAIASFHPLSQPSSIYRASKPVPMFRSSTSSLGLRNQNANSNILKAQYIFKIRYRNSTLRTLPLNYIAAN
jgi:hypothetical protein